MARGAKIETQLNQCKKRRATVKENGAEKISKFFLGSEDGRNHRSRLKYRDYISTFMLTLAHLNSYAKPTTPPSHALPPSKMADKLRAQQQLESLQARYIGTGNSDTTKFEWTSNIARDSLSSYIGHPPMLQYMSIGLGQSREKTRIQLLERMIQPVGKPPEVSGCYDGHRNLANDYCSHRTDRILKRVTG